MIDEELEIDREELMNKTEKMSKKIGLSEEYRSINTEALTLIWDQFELFLKDDHSDGSYAEANFELWLEGFLIGYIHSGTKLRGFEND